MPIRFLLLSLAVGCGEVEEGYQWAVTVASAGTSDSCGGQELSEGANADYTFTLFFDGSAADIHIDQRYFASGNLSGCRISYQTPVLGERRGADEEFWVKWILTGDAVLRQGDASCELDPGIDWLGEETYLVVDSDYEDIPERCEVYTTVEGVYLGKGI